MSTRLSSPENNNLHEVNLDSTTIPNNHSEYLYFIVETVLWTTKRAQTAFETAVSFLCTVVKSPTEQDKNKLKILLHFINQTVEDRRVIGADLIINLLSCIDSSYTLQPDMNGHNVGVISNGWVLIHCTS